MLLVARTDTIEPVSFCGGADDPSVSSPYVCCGTPVGAAECCSSGDDGGGFGWYNASIVNYEMTPTAGVASVRERRLFVLRSMQGHYPLTPRLCFNRLEREG